MVGSLTSTGQSAARYVDRLGERAARHGVKPFTIGTGGAFSKLHLADLELETLQDHPEFCTDFNRLIQSMQAANHLGSDSVLAYTFAWPGEYFAGKPTWPMRWLTRGGAIADVDMEKLVKVFSLMAEQAEKYNIDVVLANLPWHYTNTTSHCRALVERVGSKQIKIMWHPSDNLTAGESDSATAGFINVRPYLYSLHVKDLRVIDGLKLNFEYCPLGEGDVDYLTVLRNLRDHRCDVIFESPRISYHLAVLVQTQCESTLPISSRSSNRWRRADKGYAVIPPS